MNQIRLKGFILIMYIELLCLYSLDILKSTKDLINKSSFRRKPESSPHLYLMISTGSIVENIDNISVDTNMIAIKFNKDDPVFGGLRRKESRSRYLQVMPCKM